MKKSLLLTIILLVSGMVSARERININRGWRYCENDPAGADSSLHYSRLKPYLLPTANDFILFGEKRKRPAGNPGAEVAYVKPEFDDSGWRKLNLPHDWAIEGPFDINYDGATGKLPYWGTRWYRKSIDLPEADSCKQIYLDIDGAMSYSSVWCNGKYVGGWPYGYASYRLDLTPYIIAREKNTIAIRLESPDEASRWYPGAGLYRNVWLTKTSPVHVSQWETFVRNVTVSPDEAVMEMGVRLENHSKKDRKVNVSTDIYRMGLDGSPEGEPVARFENRNVTVRRTGKITAANRFKVENPQLWDTENPNMYIAVTEVIGDGEQLDRYETPFGIRTAEFTLDNGFELNGRRVQLKGVCMHHDLGALGAAFNVTAAERQLKIMKEMGVNAIRTSHNPPAPELVALCDRMGLLMQLELADTWHNGKRKNDYSRLFDDWSEADMRSLVRHYRNHPSVIMWSIGNECPDQSSELGFSIAHKLTAYSHDEDPTRPTSYGSNKTDAQFRELVNQVDVFGQNYNLKAYSNFFKQNPTRRYHGSETASATSSRGEYFFPVTSEPEDNRADFQLSSYDMATVSWGYEPDVQFEMLEKYPKISGEFVWTGFDYIGEPTPYNDDMTNVLNFSDPAEREKARKELEELGRIKSPSRSSYFGIVDLCGFPKDRYYYYKSYWLPDIPTAHILPHWNWENRIGEVTPVYVYTSGDEVELFLNGKSLGRKKKENDYDRLKWMDVIYAPGELKAVGYKNGVVWAEDVVETTGKPARLLVTPESDSLRSDGDDLIFVRVAIADAKGRIVPTANNRLKFSVSGAAEIVATDNGNATDLTVFSSHERDAYNGLALVILKGVDGKSGDAVLTVESKGLPKNKVKIPVKP